MSEMLYRARLKDRGDGTPGDWVKCQHETAANGKSDTVTLPGPESDYEIEGWWGDPETLHRLTPPPSR
jgi:hypothetical protein